MSSWLVRGWIVSMLLLLGIATASAQYCTNGSACNPSSLNNIVFVDGVTNTTLAAAKAALLAISPSGGVIDMRGVHTGSGLSLGTFDPGNGVQITLLLGPYAYTANQITLRTGLAVIGPGATITSSNASNAPLIVIPQIAGQPAQHVYLQGLHLAGFSGNTSQDAVFADCSNATGNGLFYSNFDDINIQGFKGVGLHLRCRANDYSSVNQFNVFRNVQVFRVSGGAEALVIEGAAAQTTFIGGQFDGQAEGDGTNIYIGEYNSGSVNPDNIQFIGTTTQSAAVGVQFNGATNLTMNGVHLESLQGGFLFTNGGSQNREIDIHDSYFATVGVHAGAGYALNTQTSGGDLRLVVRNNEFASAPDNYIIGASGTTTGQYIKWIDNDFPTPTTLLSYASTPQMSPTTTLVTGPAHVVGLNPSSTVITTIESTLGVGETLTLYACCSGAISIGTGGNINLGSNASPLVLSNQDSATFILEDLNKSFRLIGKSH